MLSWSSLQVYVPLMVYNARDRTLSFPPRRLLK